MDVVGVMAAYLPVVRVCSSLYREAHEDSTLSLSLSLSLSNLCTTHCWSDSRPGRLTPREELLSGHPIAGLDQQTDRKELLATFQMLHDIHTEIYSTILKMEAADVSVKSVNFHQSTWRHMPESDLTAVRKSRNIYPKSEIFLRRKPTPTTHCITSLC